MTAPTGEDRMMAALAARGASPSDIERARRWLRDRRERRRAREAREAREAGRPDALPVFVSRVHAPALLGSARREADRRWAAEQRAREVDGVLGEVLAQVRPGSEDGR